MPYRVSLHLGVEHWTCKIHKKEHKSAHCALHHCVLISYTNHHNDGQRRHNSQVLGNCSFTLVPFTVSFMQQLDSFIRGKSTDFSHLNLFAGVEQYHCICEYSCTKAFVAKEGAEPSLMNVFKRCHSSQGWLVVMTTSLKNEKKKKKYKRAVQLDSCNHVISFRPSEQPNGKKRACQPPTSNSESETSGNSKGCDISHLAE